MRISAFSNFKKLWGKITQNLKQGTYQIDITNNWPVYLFNGSKKLSMTQVNSLGGKNYFLGYLYIIVGSISIILAVAFIIRKMKRPDGLVAEKLKEIKEE